MLEVLLGLARLAYALLTLFYALSIAILVGNLLRQAIVRLRDRRAAAPAAKLEPRSSLDNSLALNALVSLFSTALVTVVVAVSPLGLGSKLVVLALVISASSYLWGWRATGLGIINGTAWAAGSLAAFAALEPGVDWWTYAPAFLLFNLLGHLTGWLGGFVRGGRIHESQCVSAFTFELSGDGDAIEGLIKTYACTVSEFYRRRWVRNVEVTANETSFLTAVGGTSEGCLGAVLNGRHETEVVHSYLPALMSMQWVFEHPAQRRSVDEILDYVCNWLFRRVTTRMVVQVEARREGGLGSRYDSLERSETTANIVLSTFRQTPSIVWVDEETADFARELHESVLVAVRGVHLVGAELHDPVHAIIESWKGRPKLEQHAKRTRASRAAAVEYVGRLRFDAALCLPEFAVREIQDSQGLIDRWRSKTATIVVFLFSNILVGIMVNYLSTFFEKLD